MNSPSPDFTGRILGYNILTNRMGSGSMGIVYTAQDTHLERNVVAKVLPAGRGKLYLTDVRSIRMRKILSLAPNEIQWPAVSGDNRLIASRTSTIDAGVWMATFK